MPLQIKRHLIILAVMVVLFLLFRYLMIPESFGELGHYRANSLQDNELLEMKYAGRESCGDCHEDKAELLKMNLHSGLSCETCHGPGMAHIENSDSGKLIIPESREACGICHSQNPARKQKVVMQIDLNDHNPGNNCNYCHNPHAPWELRNQETPEENF